MANKTALILFCLLFAAVPTAAQDDASREAVGLEIEQLSASGHLGVRGIEVASGDLLIDVYERNRFELAWPRIEQIGELVAAITASHSDGLNPADYHLDEVQKGYEQLLTGEAISARDRAELDLMFTDSLIRLGYHQRYGKLNPSTLDPQWNFRRDASDEDAADSILTAIRSPSLLEHFESQFPRGSFYSGLQNGLAKYRQIQADGGWPEFPDGPTLKPGASDERVATLAQRLSVTGDLPADAIVAVSGVYGETLEAAVRNFQQRHGLDVDGIIGPSTVRALNVTAGERVRQLEVNLERTRWVFDDISDEFILVNIAGFEAYVVRDSEIVWRTKVQVGKPFHKSPVFRDEMKYVVFNPTWTVPYSIATKEMLPDIQSDPDYFAKRDFDVKDRDGNIVDPKSINWASLSRGNFPYTLVQRPGPNNALGRVKFMFPNEHAVYLHDTPSKYLFGRAERAFSHGCIRTENPFDFAEVLLGRDGWNQRRFKEILDSGETKTVFLSKTIPVLLLYWTAEVRPDGIVHFYQDIYERDQAVAEGLDSVFALDPPARKPR